MLKNKDKILKMIMVKECKSDRKILLVETKV